MELLGMWPRAISIQLSHWYKQFEGTKESPQKIYELVENAINKREYHIQLVQGYI